MSKEAEKNLKNIHNKAIKFVYCMSVGDEKIKLPQQTVFLEVPGRGTCHDAGCPGSPPDVKTSQHTVSASLSNTQLSPAHETICQPKNK